jgi:hypothetical protein
MRVERPEIVDSASLASRERIRTKASLAAQLSRILSSVWNFKTAYWEKFNLPIINLRLCLTLLWMQVITMTKQKKAKKTAGKLKTVTHQKQKKYKDTDKVFLNLKWKFLHN